MIPYVKLLPRRIKKHGWRLNMRLRQGDGRTRLQWMSMMSVLIRVSLYFTPENNLLTGNSEPTAESIQLDLTQQEGTNGVVTGSISWLASGIKLRSAQYVYFTPFHILQLSNTLKYRLSLQSEVRRLGKNISVEDQLKLYDKRHRLQTRIDTFILEGKAYLPSSDEEEEGGNFQLSSMVWEDDEEADEEDEEPHPVVDPDSNATYPERQVLPLPSSYSISENSPALLWNLAEQEFELEKGQANDTLHKLRLAIAHKSFLYRHKVRKASSYAQRNRAYDDVRTYSTLISYHADVYSACWRTLVALRANEETLEKYKILKKEDLKVDTAVVNPNERGQRNYQMSWIWGVSELDSTESPQWLDEGKQIQQFVICHLSYPLQFIVSIFSEHGQECSGGVRRKVFFSRRLFGHSYTSGIRHHNGISV